MADYYVVAASGGSDSNAGTLAAPFATLGHAQTVMRSSIIKICYLRAGTYTFGSSAQFLGLTSSDNGTVWSGYPGDQPNSAVLQFGTLPTWPVAGTVSPCSNITFTNLTFDGGPSGGVGPSSGFISIVASNHIYINRCVFQNSSKAADIVGWNNDYIYFQGNISGPNEYQSISQHINDGRSHGNIFITDNLFYGFSRMGVELQTDIDDGSHWFATHIDRNVFSEYTGASGSPMGISFVTGHSGFPSTGAAGNTIWGNTFNGTPGLAQWGIEASTPNISICYNVFTGVDLPISISAANGQTIENNSFNIFANSGVPFGEDGGYNGTEWIGMNEWNGVATNGWPTHTYTTRPGVHTPSGVFISTQ